MMMMYDFGGVLLRRRRSFQMNKYGYVRLSRGVCLRVIQDIQT